MARLARVVVAGVPHHVTQRGNRRQVTFFEEGDYHAYLSLMAKWCDEFSVEIWAYCLMPNHVHLIAVPETADGLARAIGEAHRRYTRQINRRQEWLGHLWQGRFASFPMNRGHTVAAARYIELNPVRALLVNTPEDYPWSSARAHLGREDDRLVRVLPLLDEVGDWRAFLNVRPHAREWDVIRRHERTGRPLGDDSFLAQLETRTGRQLRRTKPGPKPKRLS